MDEPVTAIIAGTRDSAGRRHGAGRTAGRPQRAACAWMAGTLHGLTWRRFGIFSLVLLTIALSESPAIRTLVGEGGWAEKSVELLKVWLYVLLIFTPVLLLVVSVDNRGPSAGRRRVAALAAAVGVGQAVGTLLWFGAVRILYPDGFLPHRLGTEPDLWMQLRFFIGYGLLLGSVSMTATAFWYLLRRAREAAAALHRERQHREQAERERVESQLAVMQAQVEPHFLFNTLASVRRLYETDPASGRRMLQELSRYLAASLPMLREARSTLGGELALAIAYLNVHKIRMGGRLEYAVDVPPSLAHVVVPPMMLATLVENAVIHGLNPLPEGGTIRISARADADRFTLQVADTGRGLKDAWGGGVGLTNIRTRLASEFGAAAALELAAGPVRGVTATLSLPHPAGRGTAA